MKLWNKILRAFGLVTVSHMEQRFLQLRQCDALAEMEWMDEIDERFQRLESRLPSVEEPFELEPMEKPSQDISDGPIRLRSWTMVEV